jgi:hypothetical protein
MPSGHSVGGSGSGTIGSAGSVIGSGVGLGAGSGSGSGSGSSLSLPSSSPTSLPPSSSTSPSLDALTIDKLILLVAEAITMPNTDARSSTNKPPLRNSLIYNLTIPFASVKIPNVSYS